MQYSFLFSSPGLPEQPEQAVPIPAWQPRRWVTLPVFMIGVMNGLFLALAPPVKPSSNPQALYALPAYQGIAERFTSEEVLTVHMTGRFDISGPASHQIVSALLQDFENVGVIVFPDEGASIILASDTSSFQQNALTEVLNAYGETRFIIYDPALVRMVVEAAQSSQ